MENYYETHPAAACIFKASNCSAKISLEPSNCGLVKTLKTIRRPRYKDKFSS